MDNGEIDQHLKDSLFDSLPHEVPDFPDESDDLMITDESGNSIHYPEQLPTILGVYSLNPEYNLQLEYGDNQSVEPSDTQAPSQNYCPTRNFSVPFDYIGPRVLRDDVIEQDYLWASNHCKNMINIFKSMEPLWPAKMTSPQVDGMLCATKTCKKYVAKLYKQMKKHQQYWEHLAATTDPDTE
ncbi:uncharacterized protein LOC144639774 isoform X1 [Oculina patagonica]